MLSFNGHIKARDQWQQGAVFLFLFASTALSQSIIKNLPGFSGDLPFKLETGYVSTGEKNNVHLFYYFIESERNPQDDPLILWLSGGPGCSGFGALVLENGPLVFNYNFTELDANSVTFKLNPHSWTKVANIIFLDAPVGTGFSYAKSWDDHFMSDAVSAKQTYKFLQKWLLAHPKFLKNPLYVCGDSYGGKVVPVVTQEIANGIDAGLTPRINLKGYMLGNPVTDRHSDANARIPFAHRMALISDNIFESMRRNCRGEYVSVDPRNTACLDDLHVFKFCTKGVNEDHVLENKCRRSSNPKPKRSMPVRSFLDASSQLPQPDLCRADHQQFSIVWANNKIVQDALGVVEGTITAWIRCNASIFGSYKYDENISSVIYHQNLIKKGYRALVYSGDHDLNVPYIGTLAWIESMNLTVHDYWRPWFVDDQVAGYIMKYTYKQNQLTFATVKGAGHTAPEYRPKECLSMVQRWLAHYPL